MLNLYKMMFFYTLITSTLISISAYSWMGMWIGLEINMLSIIPLMSNSQNTLSTEASLKYFITQAIASSVIFMSIVLLMINLQIMSVNIKSMLIMVMNSSLLTKMGVAPFHFWFPEVMEGLTWLNCMLILTWQKVAPMILIMYNTCSTSFLSIIIIISMLISGLMGLNQMTMRKILTYSSINHMGWMLSPIMFQETIWFYYFIIYTLSTISMIMVLKTYNLSTINQLFEFFAKNSSKKMMFMMNFFSLMGIPPFLGFFPKWLVIQMMINENYLMITTMMIMMTLIMVFIYMRIMASTLMMNSNKTWIPSETPNNMKISLINFISIMSLALCTMSFNLI